MNRAQCAICKDIIHSKHRHDFVACKGGHIFIDGGNDYRRCGTLTAGVTLEDILDVPDDVTQVIADRKFRED